MTIQALPQAERKYLSVPVKQIKMGQLTPLSGPLCTQMPPEGIILSEDVNVS